MADSQRKSYNLFDKDNADIVEYYTNSTTGIYTYSQNTRSVIIPCQSNKTYSATKSVQGTAPRFSLSCYDNYPQENDIATAKVLNNDAMQLTLTTTANSQYLVLFFYYLNPPNASEIQRIMDTLMVNEGQPLPYEPYGWVHSLRKLTTATEAVENPLYSDGSPITTYTLKGNEEHTGTPSPQNPVMPQGCGERTAQLIPEFLRGSASASGVNFEQIDSMTIRAYGELSSYVQQVSQISFKLSAGTYYLWLYSTNSDTKFYPQIRSVDGQTTYRTGNGSFTLTEDTVVVPRFVGSSSTATIIDENIKLMLNLGSQPLPYEPYGFKIPILTAQTTTNIYLGSVQSNRQIKKLVLTGDESFSWTRSTSYSGGFFTTWSNVGGKPYELFYCSHAQSVSDITDYVNGTCYSDGSLNIRIMPEGSTATQWREYLAQQYANGTPVTVWYVLLTDTTGIVNEPLQKIGAYSDSISNATAIPTTEGANSITVDTTVQPSEFTATWTGWHNAEVKEKSENLFDGQLQQGYYAYLTGEYTLADVYVCTHLIPCTENTTYTFRCINTGGGSKNYGYVFFDSAQNRIDSDYINVLTEGDVVTHTATTPPNTAFLAINIAYGRRQASVVRPSDITDFMLNTGSTALPYAPYWE